MTVKKIPTENKEYYCDCEHCEEIRRQQKTHGRWQQLKVRRQVLIYT